MAGGIVRAALVAVVLAPGCASDPTESWRDEQAIAVQEAVFRYQFEHNHSGLQQAAGAYCLAILLTSDDASPQTPVDPPESLLARFAGHVPPVRRVSQCRVSVAGDVDTVTGLPALVFRVGPLTWASDTDVLVEGGYHEGGLSASGNTYRVQFRSGRWVVVEDRLRWIA